MSSTGKTRFKVKPNLTITYGLRWSLSRRRGRTTGLQVAPNFSLTDFFKGRANNMVAGIPSNVDHWCKFDLAGPANGWQKGLLRLGQEELWAAIVGRVVTRPQNGLLKALFWRRDKSTLRAGFGVVYDRIGAGFGEHFRPRTDRSGCPRA